MNVPSILGVGQSRAAEILRGWRADPVHFVRSEFKVEPDPFQIEVLTDFADPANQRQAMKASKGPGKTAVESWCAWNFLATRPHPKVVATAITGDNLNDNLWPEMSKWKQKSPFLEAAFEWTKTKIFSRDHPETWWMSARTWPKSGDASQQANTLAGVHADYVLFILDESGGMPDAVMAAAEGGLSTGIEVRIIQAGNPTHLLGPLYRACTSEAHLWRIYTVNGDPDDPKRSPRVSIKWAREQIEKYGRDNPWVLINVFGQFPPASLNSLIGPDEMEKSIRTQIEETKYRYAAKVLGVDVARFGDNRSVIFPRQGLYAKRRPIVLRMQNSEQVAGHTAREYDEWEAEQIFVDDTGGWGSGVIDALIRLGYPVTPVNSSGRAFNPRYMNKRAEMYFEAAAWVRSGGCLPGQIPDIIKEATSATYFFNGGKMQIIEKDLMKDTIGVSPDLWDAFCLTFATPVQAQAPQDRMARLLGIEPRQNIVADYNPFEDERLTNA